MNQILKRAFVVLLLLAMIFTSSCTGGNGQSASDEKYAVTFDYGDGREAETVEYSSGETVVQKRPLRDGYEFIGWCTDKALSNFYDFSRPITSSVTLYAKWTVDYERLINNVSADASSAVLEIYSVGAFGSLSQGSGVVYKKNEDGYYVLTNNHVVTRDSGKISSQVYAYDVYGNFYSATVLKSDVNYDLAILSIEINEARTLDVIDLGEGIPSHNEKLVTLSVPDGKINTIDFADVSYYQKVEANTDSNPLQSNVTFEVLWLDGNVTKGASGGAVLDLDLKLVGIIYGGIKTDNASVSYVLAVPVDKVIEFIGEDFK